MDESRAGRGGVGARATEDPVFSDTELVAFANCLPEIMPIGDSKLMEYGVRRGTTPETADAMEIVLRAKFTLVQELYQTDDMTKARGILAGLPDMFLDELLQQVHREIEARGRDPRPPSWVQAYLEKARIPNTGN